MLNIVFANCFFFYREYEDQIEGLKKENLVLRTENDIISAQLRESDEQVEQLKVGWFGCQYYIWCDSHVIIMLCQ